MGGATKRVGTRVLDSSGLTQGDELVARAAWLHYAGGLTQSAIAKRFGIPTTKAHRLIARAVRDGLVRVFVDARVEGCVLLEDEISSTFGLTMCRVAPEIVEPGPLPLRALGLSGASFLMNVLEGRDHGLIGVGHGRTLSSVIDALPPIKAGNTRFVSMLGGLTRKYAANPFDVIHRLADKSGAEVFMLPAPLFANSVEDKRVILSQTGMGHILELMDGTSLCLVGIGAIDIHGTLGAGFMENHDAELVDLRRRGAKTEILGQFLDGNGATLSTRFDGRAMAPDLASLTGREVVAIAGGEGKSEAILAALKSGFLTGLITDEATARRLVAMLAEANASTERPKHASN